MEKILITLPLDEQQKEEFQAAAPDAEITYCKRGSETKELVQEANVIIGNVSPKHLDGAEQIKWIQLDSAGTEGFCEPGRLSDGTILTNATGSYGMAISEHMVGMLFMLQKHMEEYYLQQKQHKWQKLGPMLLVEESTTLVIGLGNIGSTFAKKMKALGSHVIGIRRTAQPKPEYVDEQYTMDKLQELLPKADVIALSLPAYEDTKGIIGKEEFDLMKETAVILNVGRGTAIDTDALCEALYRGKIYGAGLDVVDPEPLPKMHPLWNAPHTIITPHASGGYELPATLKKIVALAMRNLKKFEAGEELENKVDLHTGYVKRS
ncbi:MAG: D-2-hydroxyacid dehydrogenase [Clostridia bacterium]|nr:D-2-hydroxyacid dehydrogenase [Clostridia bacterium]NCC42839.1 D-2-hydroxyacid dehydrogenase [Clostridia bacterium]